MGVVLLLVLPDQSARRSGSEHQTAAIPSGCGHTFRDPHARRLRSRKTRHEFIWQGYGDSTRRWGCLHRVRVCSCRQLAAEEMEQNEQQRAVATASLGAFRY
jgi:hypothetical protein